MSQRDIKELFGPPDEWRRNAFTEAKHGVIDVALGGGIFGAIGGSAAGSSYGPSLWSSWQEATIDVGGTIILGFIGAFVGAAGGMLIGTLIGGIGEIICSKLGLDKSLRARLDGRLDDIRGRLLYGGLLGAVGGPIILFCVQGDYGWGGVVTALFTGAIFWGFWGAVGGGVDWMFSWGLQTERALGRAVIGGSVAALIGIICGAIIAVTLGAVASVMSGVILLIIVGAGVGVMADKVIRNRAR